MIRAVRGLYVELAILAACGAIISETGKTNGPVFDVVGPDFIPLSVAYIIVALTLLQIVLSLRRNIAKPLSTDEDRLPTSKVDYLWIFGFCAATGLYVVVLAMRVMPYFAVTGLFVVVTTVVLARRIHWWDIVLGAIVGTGLGTVLQYIFTQILVIDLPT